MEFLSDSMKAIRVRVITAMGIEIENKLARTDKIIYLFSSDGSVGLKK